MISSLLARLRKGLNLRHFISRLLIITGCAIFITAGFLWIPSLPFFGFILFLFSPLFILYFRRLIRRQRTAGLRLLSSIETQAFGKRRLVLDSLMEFTKNPKQSSVACDLEAELAQDKRLSMVISNNESRIRRLTLIWTVLLLIVLCSLAVLSYPAYRKAASAVNFISQPLSIVLPDYYIDSKPLKILINKDNFKNQKIMAVISNAVFLETNGMIWIPSDQTQAKELPLEIRAEKFGLNRSIVRKKLRQTSVLMAQNMMISVSYPGISGVSSESYASLQDIEAWPGVYLRIDGDSTKELAGAESSPPSTDHEITGNRFRLGLKPRQSTAYRIQLNSEDGDSTVLPDFTVRINPNQAPALKLLYPRGDIKLMYYRWNISALMEMEDDQGIASVSALITISNRDPALARFTQTRKLDLICRNEKNLTTNLSLNYQQLELYPDDVASVRITALDPFGSRSKAAVFNIITPNFMDIQNERTAQLRNMRESLSRLSNSYEKFEKKMNENNHAAADDAAQEIQQNVSNLDQSLAGLEEGKVAESLQNIKDLKESMVRMRQITEEIKKHSEDLKKITDQFQQMQDHPSPNNSANKNLKLNDMMNELESLIKNLEFYKKQSDMAAQKDMLKNLYDSLKKQNKPEDFSRNLNSYRKALEEMKKIGSEAAQALSSQLDKESENLKMGQESSFEKSDELMEKLTRQVESDIASAGKNRMQEKQKLLQKILEELYINVLILDDAANLDPGVIKNLKITNIQSIAETVNSVRFSIKGVFNDLEKVLEGMVLQENSRTALNNMKNQITSQLDTLEKYVRDYLPDGIRYQLPLLEGQINLLFLNLLKLDSSLSSAMKAQGGASAEKMDTISLSDLAGMQNSMSQALEQLLEEMKQGGKMTPEMKEMMDQLSQIQSDIRKNLQDLLSKNSEGAMEGGSEMGKGMDDIIKDLQSYSIQNDTLEKSRKLEEKLLKSQKSIDSKGIQYKRKAETAKTYQAVSPAGGHEKAAQKIDPDSLKRRNIPDYYKRLIEKFQEK